MWITTVILSVLTIILIVMYQNNILEIDEDIAQLWGNLRTPHPENALDKLIAATAIIHNLTVVTRNEKKLYKNGCFSF